MKQKSETDKSVGRVGAPQALLFAMPAKDAPDGRHLAEPILGGTANGSLLSPRFAPAVLEEPVEADEAARFVHMSPQHLKQLAREGKVPAHPRGDGQRRRWLFFLSELAVWIRGRVNSACDPCRA